MPIGNRFPEKVLYTRCLLLEVRDIGNQHLSERLIGQITFLAGKQNGSFLEEKNNHFKPDCATQYRHDLHISFPFAHNVSYNFIC